MGRAVAILCTAVLGWQGILQLGRFRAARLAIYAVLSERSGGHHALTGRMRQLFATVEPDFMNLGFCLLR